MGVTVRQQKDAWWVFAHHQGQRAAKRIGPGRAGWAAATAYAERLQAKIVLGDLRFFERKQKAPTVPTFKEVAQDWEQVNSPNWKEGTRVDYANAIKARLCPAFGPLPMPAVTPALVESWWVKTRGEHLSKKHLTTLRAILRGICRRAITLEIIRTNPVDRIEGRLGREEKEAKTGDYLTAEDLSTFLQVAERVAPKAYPIFLVMGTAGLRIGEAVTLQVGDLDGLSNQVHVRRTVSRATLSSPKSGKGRVVDVPATTMAVLGRLKAIRQAEAAVNGTEARWLFPSTKKSKTMPVTPESVGQAFTRARRAAGIRKLRPHDLRHTYATLAIQAGVPLLTVSRQLGHASISTTADTYTHAIPGSNRAAAEVFEGILTRNHAQPPRNLENAPL
jgi:integrase